MLLSIVIPAYNVDAYISRCLDSCICQSIPKDDYEMIIVNDGSTDRTLDIASEYANQYKNIRILSQENKGLSEARNTGLCESSGKYVWFVDSDDWIERDCLNLVFQALKADVDLLEIQYQLVFEDGKIQEGSPTLIKGIIDGQTQTLAGGLPTPAQFTLYRRDFLVENQLRFMPGIYHEDCEFKPRAVLLAKRISSVSTICYNYFQRTSGSITSSYKIKNATDAVIALNSVYDFVQPYDEKIKAAVYGKISMWINSILLGMESLGREERKKVIDLFAANRHLLKAMRESNVLKYILEGFILSASFKGGLFLHHILKSVTLCSEKYKSNSTNHCGA